MDYASPLRLGLDLAHWSTHDLWLAAFTMGGNLSNGDIDRIVGGDTAPTRSQYDVFAYALNEHLHFDLDLDNPISNWEEISGLDRR